MADVRFEAQPWTGHFGPPAFDGSEEALVRDRGPSEVATCLRIDPSPSGSPVSGGTTAHDMNGSEPHAVGQGAGGRSSRPESAPAVKEAFCEELERGGS